MHNLVKLEKKDGWAIMTLDDKATLNALGVAISEDIAEAVDEIEVDDSIRAVVVTGSGKSFVSGGDLAYMKGLGAQEAIKFTADFMKTMEKMTSSSKIYIAAVNGLALGGGCELALSCDIRIASEKAKFGFPEVTFSILPGCGGTQRLPRVIGMGRAMDMILTGRIISAQKAYDIGLVTDLAPADELMAKAEEIVNMIKRTGPIGAANAKSCIYQAANTPLDAGLIYERQMWGLCYGTEDKTEGMQAFFEKRPPVFNGK